MTNGEKKTYLKSYLMQSQKVREMQERYKRLFISKTSISASYDGMPRAKNYSGLEDYAAERDMLAREIIQQKEKCMDALEDIFFNIEQITGPDSAKAAQYRIVLNYKYIVGLKHKEIAREIGSTEGNIRNLHSQALEQFEVRVRTM